MIEDTMVTSNKSVLNYSVAQLLFLKPTLGWIS